jgi:hypothetical protein
MAELQAGVVMPSLDNLSVSYKVTGAHWAMYNTQLKYLSTVNMPGIYDLLFGLERKHNFNATP